MQKKLTDAKVIGQVWAAIGEKGAAPKVLTVSCPKADTPPSPCACGCRKLTPSTWVPGHDAKRKSFLFAEYRSGDEARKAAAAKEMTERDWPLPNAKQDRKATTKAS